MFSFYAHMGRLHDLVEKLGAAIGDTALGKDLTELYTQRNNVLHEARAPMLLVGGNVGVVPPAGKADNPNRWGKHRTWSDLDRLEMVELATLLAETLNEAISLLENALARAYSRMHSSPLKDIAEKLSGIAKLAPLDGTKGGFSGSAGRL